MPEFGFWYMEEIYVKIKKGDWHLCIPDYDPPKKIGADYFMIFIIISLHGQRPEELRVKGVLNKVFLLN